MNDDGGDGRRVTKYTAEPKSAMGTIAGTMSEYHDA